MKTNFLLFAIVALGFFLRIYNVGALPNSVNRDEAALAYNAYSLLQTGNDEFGNHLPLTFTSFGDYKLPGYIYPSIPLIYLFGLNAFSIRLLSVLAGTVSLIILYLLTKQITQKPNLALLATLFLAISPWGVFYSRVAFEVNLALCLFSAGILSLINVKKSPYLIILGSGLIAYSLFTYNNPYLVGPAVLLAFALGFYKDYTQTLKHKICTLIAFCILLISCGVIFASIWQVSAAKSQITIFKSPEIYEQYHQYIVSNNSQSPLPGFLKASIFNRILNHQVVFLSTLFVQNVAKNFSPQFLIQRDGSHIWSGIPNIGHIYLTDYVFFLVGIFSLLFSKSIEKKYKYLLYSWLVVGVFPAALTIHQAQPNRSLFMFFLIPLFSAYGVYRIFEYFQKYFEAKKYIALFGVLVACVFFLNSITLIYRYFVQFSNQSAGWYPNLETTFQKIDKQDPKTLVLSNELPEAYIYYLFYSKFDPKVYQETVVRSKDAEGFYHVHSFGNVLVSNFNTLVPDELKQKGKVIIFGLGTEPAFANKVWPITETIPSAPGVNFVYASF